MRPDFHVERSGCWNWTGWNISGNRSWNIFHFPPFFFNLFIFSSILCLDLVSLSMFPFMCCSFHTIYIAFVIKAEIRPLEFASNHIQISLDLKSCLPNSTWCYIDISLTESSIITNRICLSASGIYNNLYECSLCAS